MHSARRIRFDRVVRRLITSVSVIATGLLVPAASSGQSAPSPRQERRMVTAVRLTDGESISLDGRLDEPVWQRATPASNFVQVDPQNGQPATEQTEVFIAFSGKAFYMGVICHDSEPDRWLGYQRRRDEFLQSDDRFMWVIDTYLDGRSGYFFEMNPSGLMGDALRGVGVNNRQWDGIWNAKARRSEVGWTLEVEIPFQTLNFDPNSDTWGINFQRTVRRKNEDSVWMGWARNQGLNRLTNAGLVSGLSQVSQGHGLDVKPYGLLAGASAPGRGQTTTSLERQAGVDVFYSPSPRLRANLTVNTDFAQTEVDQRQVNLTRFSLFFPEKRDFFLDGVTFFDFGSVTTTTSLSGNTTDNGVTPFFSRRIGLTAAGEAQPITGGGKLTGQVGRQDVGALFVRTRDDNGVDGESFAVLRVKRRVLRQSYFGGLYTGRMTPGADDRQTAGVDFQLATSTFLGSENFNVGGYYLHTTNPAAIGNSDAFGLRAEYPNDFWNAAFAFREVQPNFSPAVGFVPRTGFHQYTPTFSVNPRPKNSALVRRVSVGAEGNILSDMGSQLLERTVTMTPLQVELQSQDTLTFSVVSSHERLERNFAISRGITLPAGREYDYTRYVARASTANRRTVALDGRVEWGSFYSGTRQLVVANVPLRVRPGVIIYLGTEWNRVDLAEGSFRTRLYRLVPELQFSPWISLVNNIQYDSVSAVLGWQSRFRWILKPGSDIYAVYTQNWQDEPVDHRFTTLDRRMATKVLYTLRF